jgi:hypothetical protein
MLSVLLGDSGHLRHDPVSARVIRRILPIMAMVITPSPRCLKMQQGRLLTRVSFRSADPSQVGQFSVGRNKALFPVKPEVLPVSGWDLHERHADQAGLAPCLQGPIERSLPDVLGYR